MMANSLTKRLITTSLIWVFSALVIAALLLIMLFHGYIEQRFEDSLQGHLEELVAAGDVQPDGRFKLNWKPTDPRFNRPYSGWYWEIRQADTSIYHSASLWKDKLQVKAPVVGEEPDLLKLIGPKGESIQALVQQISYPQSERSLLFVVAGPNSDIWNDVVSFSIQVASTLFALGVGLLLAVWFQVRFGLKPLKDLTLALKDIRQGKAGRLPQHFPAEVEPVVNELNALLDNNESLLKRARTHVANLAHALKNPLTVIRNESHSMEDEKGQVIKRQADAMASSMDRYLSRARIAGAAGLLGARTELEVILNDIVFGMNQLYRERNIKINHSSTENCIFQGEAEDLEEMMGNLIDNACKWARSKVEITASCSGDQLVIKVEDDGDGIPESLLQTVIKRGHRLDEDTPGSGLGLDIVRDIAELYRGSLELEQSTDGGVRASLTLPAAT